MIELLAQAIRVLSDAWAQSSFASNVVFLPAAGAVGSDAGVSRACLIGRKRSPADAVLDEDEDASEDVATAENSRPSSQSAPAAKGSFDFESQMARAMVNIYVEEKPWHILRLVYELRNRKLT